MRVFETGFQFHTPSKKENILSEKKNVWVKFHVLLDTEKSQLYGIFKKSMLDFNDALFRLSNHF